MLKEIIKALLLGLIALLAINFVGQYFKFNIPINIITITLLGVFRLPGLIVILIFMIL